MSSSPLLPSSRVAAGVKHGNDIGRLVCLAEHREVGKAAEKRPACLVRRQRKLFRVFRDPLHHGRKAWRNSGTISGAWSSYHVTASARSALAAAVKRTCAIHCARPSSSRSICSHGTAVLLSASNVAMRRASSASCAGVNRTSSAARLSQSSPIRSSLSRGVNRVMSSVVITHKIARSGVNCEVARRGRSDSYNRGCPSPQQKYSCSRNVRKVIWPDLAQRNAEQRRRVAYLIAQDTFTVT
jgi:hypothetical protein